MKKTAGQKKIAKVMGEYKRGTLHAGINPKGPAKAPMRSRASRRLLLRCPRLA